MGSKFLYFLKKIVSDPGSTIRKIFVKVSSYLSSIVKVMFIRPSSLAAVVIPVYKNIPNENEIVSLKQCLALLGNKYPLVFVCPQNLKRNAYVDLCKGFDNIRFEIFDDFYFEGLDGYSALMTSIGFYERFYAYKFILIYQLDVFIFRDELGYWCDQNYDYIGSPWLGTDRHNSPELRSSLPFWRSNSFFRKLWKEKDRSVGNGGFSLRKVKSMGKSLLFYKRSLRKWRHYEDTFFSIALPNIHPFFKIPDQQIALRFGVELEPKKAFEMLNGKLPFGCHAWEKRDPDFWKPIIESYGYKLPGKR